MKNNLSKNPIEILDRSNEIENDNIKDYIEELFRSNLLNKLVGLDINDFYKEIKEFEDIIENKIDEDDIIFIYNIIN